MAREGSDRGSKRSAGRTERKAKPRLRAQSSTGQPTAAKPPAKKARAPANPRRAGAGGADAEPTGDVRGATADATEALPRIASPVPVVGVGASAGGLEAFSQLLHELPEEPRFAFVLIQHQAPQHESALPELLAGQSRLPVVQATDGIAVEAGHVYVNPPNAQVTIEEGRLRLAPRPTDRSQYMPIDAFLRSLAADCEDKAIAVILSGTASDGTVGVRDVKGVGGITIAQRPDTARYDGMPRAAIASGLVDLVLAPAEIAATLAQMGRHPYLHVDSRADADDDRPAGDSSRAQLFERILALLRSATGVDFRQYKRPTIERRVHRRMVLQRLTALEQYVRFLEESPAEVQALFHDILILVTRFFRDPEAFEALRTHALPRVLESRTDDEPIRVWVAGCSTGEEAYSIAMLILEFLGDRGSSVPVQVFATDVSESAIEHARNGLYSASILADVSSGRLRRFFAKVDGGYRIGKSVRDVCVFARQDLTRDPPFSRMDLILCRNVLIYLNGATQQKLMSVFHYALRPVGFLLLGTAETIGQSTGFFRTEDKRVRLYAKRALSAAQRAMPPQYSAPFPQRSRGTVPVAREDSRSVQAEASRVIQERFAPPGVIVDAEMQIAQFRGHTGGFLEPSPGDPSLSLLKMAREGLLYGLRTAVQAARRDSRPVRREGLHVKRNGSWYDVAIEVIPLAASDRPHFLILFHEQPSPASTAPRAKGKAAPPHRPEREDSRQTRQKVERLQQELESSREYLQSMIQDLEAANEELQSANEEVLSANEELQSTNEELDTAKEELQSTNEELNTVNDELRGRNEDLSRANSDLENLLGSVQIAIVIVARDLRIRRFTPMAERVLNLIPSDVGRPIGHIKPNVECPDLEPMILEVLDSVSPKECEVRDLQGTAYSLSIRPYKDLENRIDGAVLTLVDVQATRERDRELRWLRRYVEAIVHTAHEPLAVLDAEGRIASANRAFWKAFAASPDDGRGRRLWELPGAAAEVAPIREWLDGDWDRGDGPPVELEREFPLDGGERMYVRGRRIAGDEGRDALFVLAFRQLRDEARPG